MASDNPWKRLQEEATCSICWKYYVNPCILDCGHCFCVACVAQCWMEFPDHTACPECRTAVERSSCRQNTLLANVVEIAKQLSSQVKEEGGGEKICGKHLEPSRTVFCVEDQIVFCQACEKSKQQHRNHRITSVEETAQLYKDCYSRNIMALKQKRTEMVRYKFLIAEWGEQLQRQSVIDHQMIAAGFRQLHDVLIRLEGHLLWRTESVPREIAEKKNRDLARLRLEIFSLENNIRLLEEKASQPVHVLLRDAMETFQRCQRRARLLDLDLSLELKWGFWELWEASAMMRGLANYITGMLDNACSMMRANVTLDGDTHHPRLLLSPDGKSMKLKPTAETLPKSPKRFDKLSCVVGCQEFTVGCYFWDVIVKEEGEWAVGVAKSSVKRKGFFRLCVEEGVYAIGKLGQHYRLINVPQSPFLLLEGELRRIRVCLNCPAGQVTFYDMVEMKIIFVLPGIGCFPEPFLPFFWLNGQTQLTIV